ncbi:DUF4865 family protein [Herbihabitans rhizosphaerae]|nr:DUF4865 family protein [Herbihabitans rhizosphaerae]
MQYEITLPADYDMAIIRHRVATRGHLLDDFDGLGVKAYLVRERGVDGSPVNQYAPFYVWHRVAGMSRFLLGGAGFQGIVDSFGRPGVRHWTGAAFHRGTATSATAATRHTEPIPDGADPAEAIKPALDELAETAATHGVHSTVLAVDPQAWELVRFTLWEGTPEVKGHLHYQVLHTSVPHLDELTDGPAWSR